MRALDRETLATLARHLGWPAISLTMPLRRPGGDAQGDRIRLKNLLRTAEERLAEGGMRPAEMKSLMNPVWAFHDDLSRWRTTWSGLAVFITKDSTEVFRTRLRVTESLSVEDRFSLKPVLPELKEQGHFYVLALSQKRVRLFHGNAENLDEMEINDTPLSLSEALKYDDYDNQLQFHSGTSSGASGSTRRSAIFHGHGGSADTAKTDLGRFFRMVDHGIHGLLKNEQAPLVLAGVEYLLSIYRSVETYAHVVETPILGNPDEISSRDMQALALDALSSHFNAGLEQDLERFHERKGSRDVSRDLPEIVTAAHEGRVDVLFLKPTGAPEWGTYNASSGLVEVHPERSPGDWDLADLAAAETLLHGGSIHALDAEQPLREPAALFRF